MRVVVCAGVLTKEIERLLLPIEIKIDKIESISELECIANASTLAKCNFVCLKQDRSLYDMLVENNNIGIKLSFIETLDMPSIKTLVTRINETKQGKNDIFSKILGRKKINRATNSERLITEDVKPHGAIYIM